MKSDRRLGAAEEEQRRVAKGKTDEADEVGAKFGGGGANGGKPPKIYLKFPGTDEIVVLLLGGTRARELSTSSPLCFFPPSSLGGSPLRLLSI